MSIPKIRKQIESRIQDVGDTMAGFLTLSGNPTSDLHAATKQYVDNKVPSVAETANKLSSAKTISLTGDVSGSGNFDGSNNLSITATVADNSHNHSNYLSTSGGTMTGSLIMGSASEGIITDFKGNTDNPFITLLGYPGYGIRYHEGTPDKMTFSASGNASTPSSADLCINGNGEGTVTIKGKTILHTGNYSSYALPLSGGELTGVVSRKYPASSDDQVRTWNDVFSWSARNASGKGTLKIAFPVSWTNSMVIMEVDVFIYASDTYGGHSAKYLIGFYNYQPTPGWYHVFCYAIGGYGLPGITMRLAHDGSKCCLLLGSTTYTWNYPMVNISKVTEHYGKEAGWGGTYTASLLTSESSLTNIQTLYVNGLAYGYNVRANNRYYQGAYAGNLGCIQSSAPGSGQMLWAW